MVAEYETDEYEYSVGTRWMRKGECFMVADVGGPNAKANAALISAAPELLAACLEALSVVGKPASMASVRKARTALVVAVTMTHPDRMFDGDEIELGAKAHLDAVPRTARAREG